MANVIIMPETERPPPLNVGGFMITVLASHNDTSGYEIFHQAGPEDKGPGPHFHPWDESFFVLRGELHCGIDGIETVAKAGTLIHVPGGSTHWFRFGPGGGELLAMTSRGNASAMFTDYDRGVDWGSPDREQLIALASRHGQTIVR
jgi:quercetin dioxygenase-like cupin family protein